MYVCSHSRLRHADMHMQLGSSGVELQIDTAMKLLGIDDQCNWCLYVFVAEVNQMCIIIK